MAGRIDFLAVKQKPRDHELQRRARDEQIDQACDDDAEQAHQQERPHSRHVTPRGVAVEAERAERGGGDEEHPHDRGVRINQEDRGQRNPHQRGERPEQKLGGRRRQAVDTSGNHEHHGERRQNE
jgi:hypothetical protein